MSKAEPICQRIQREEGGRGDHKEGFVEDDEASKKGYCIYWDRNS